MPIAFDGKVYEDEYALETGRPVEEPTEPAGASKPLPRVYITKRDENAPETPGGPQDEIPIITPTEPVQPAGGTIDWRDVEAQSTLDVTQRQESSQKPADWMAIPKALSNIRMTDIVKGIVESAGKAFTLPGKVSQGLIAPDSQQAIEQSLDLAGMMVFGPAPVAAKMADGTLGSFAGVKGKTVNKELLNKANEMAGDGVHPDEIYGKTGFYKSADGRWRYEIDDSKSNLKADLLKETKWGEDAPVVSIKPAEFNYDTMEWSAKPLLKDVLHHPDLFNAYPFLKNIEIAPVEKGSRNYGSYDWNNNVIRMAELKPEQFHSTLMHEVQHAIQYHEGFVNGSSPKMFTSSMISSAKEQLIAVKQEIEPEIRKKLITEQRFDNFRRIIEKDMDGEIPKEAESLVRDFENKYPLEVDRMRNIIKAERLIQKHEDGAYEMYRRTMGEVEARNVQARLDWDKFKRAFNSPTSSQDVPNYQQINPYQ